MTDTQDHREAGAWVGRPGQCGVRCSCGVTFDGFDALGEPTALLAQHIADAVLSSSTPRPTIGQVVRDCEHLLAQTLAILDRDPHPGSLPPVAGLTFHQLQSRRTSAAYHVEQALRDLAAIGDLPLPPVGSAVTFPARQDPEAAPPASQVATTGGPAGSSVAPVAEVHPGSRRPPGVGAACRTVDPWGDHIGHQHDHAAAAEAERLAELIKSAREHLTRGAS